MPRVIRGFISSSGDEPTQKPMREREYWQMYARQVGRVMIIKDMLKGSTDERTAISHRRLRGKFEGRSGQSSRVHNGMVTWLISAYL